jgi:pimeloyl-ACP methyl ester carboxylesterase
MQANKDGYVQLGDVRTWYAEYGDGEPLVLLHPGGGGIDARALDPSLGAFARRFRVYTPERRAHGRTPDPAGPVTYDLMAQDTVAFLETVVGGPARLAGVSDGAVVALLTARARPDLVSRLVLVSGVFHQAGWQPETFADPDPEFAAYLARAYAEVSPDGAGHFGEVVAKLGRMHAEEPTLSTTDLAAVTPRTLVMCGDDDEPRMEHTLDLYRGLPDAELAVLPGTSHGLMAEKPDLFHSVILSFLTTDPVPTIAPIRRK